MNNRVSNQRSFRCLEFAVALKTTIHPLLVDLLKERVAADSRRNLPREQRLLEQGKTGVRLGRLKNEAGDGIAQSGGNFFVGDAETQDCLDRVEFRDQFSEEESSCLPTAPASTRFCKPSPREQSRALRLRDEICQRVRAND